MLERHSDNRNYIATANCTLNPHKSWIDDFCCWNKASTWNRYREILSITRAPDQVQTQLQP